MKRDKRTPEEQHAIEAARVRRKAEKRARAEASTQIKSNLTALEWQYVMLLRAKAKEIGRPPTKEHMGELTPDIKALFGPWPRALRAAGLIPDYHKPDKWAVKHKRQKKKRKEYAKQKRLAEIKGEKEEP